MRDEPGAVQEIVTRVAVALVVALAFSPAIHGVTAALSASVGQAWPFVLAQCRAAGGPGCAFAEPGPLVGEAWRLVRG